MNTKVKTVLGKERSICNIQIDFPCEYSSENFTSQQDTHTHTHTRVNKYRFTVVHMEKDMQVMIITIPLLTQKKVTMAQ